MKLFKSVFGAILVVSFLQIGYSCSSDFHRFNDELDEIKVDGATTRGMAGHRMSLVDSVAETDEFVEYMIALNSLYKKSDEYFSKLNKQEIEMLESTAKLNNVEDVDAGIGYSDLYQALKSEMDMVVRTARILHEKTGPHPSAFLCRHCPFDAGYLLYHGTFAGSAGICTDFGGWKQRPRNRVARCTGPADQPVGIWSQSGTGNF